MPESYRDAPKSEPLIWTARQAVFALDTATGELRWRHDADDMVTRLFRLGDRLYLLTGTGMMSCLHLESGRALGTIELGFRVTAGLTTADTLFVAGPRGAAAIDHLGNLRWRALQKVDDADSLLGVLTAPSAVECARGGEVLWKEHVTGSGAYDNPGLLLGQRAAQPDLDSVG